MDVGNRDGRSSSRVLGAEVGRGKPDLVVLWFFQFVFNGRVSVAECECRGALVSP